MRTELSELGEFPLIERLTRDIVCRNPSTLKGIGDDAAILAYGENAVIITKDLLIENVHFDLSYVPLKHLGYKAAIVNFSDIAAMNGLPGQMVVGLGVSNRFSVEALEEIYQGLKLACKVYGVDFIGGDTVSSRSGLVISVTVIGEAPLDRIVYRGTANTNDLLAVTGDLGAAYAGLLMLEREKQVYLSDPKMQPDLEGHDYIIGRQLKPEARTDVVKLLLEKEIKPTSMIDISDGLASEIIHICKASGAGCNLYENKIPIDPSTINAAHEFNISPVTFALNGGEDYELLFTVSQSDFPKIKELTGVSIIGHITGKGEGMNLITSSGSQVPLTAQGWDAFLKSGQNQNESGK
ncbi:MAG: thiamine-phosphate kinase [Bacteroidales bacterium]|nr:thiamine-phosphate kinase [Bacteroidales bacterium]